ncbi:HAD family phosphatase [Corynebacterium sp. HMSC29G08]|uniref:HAD family hydrolase n=1 Tax=Corynebacterium sp. HMSC29G08 TaxID=1581069 RepID=UPI001FEDF427|nr:HAD family phosphatase [Corynebacterium sp. HMSC29G08]
MSSLPAAVFWDMDGTLVDTEPLWGIATYELSEYMGRRIPPEVRAETVGGSFENTVGILSRYTGYQLDDARVNRLRTIMHTRMAQLMGEGVDLNPGVGDLLAALHERGVPMYVTTNTPHVLADRCIAGIGGKYFVDIITGEDVAQSKPAPDMYVEAARRAGTERGNCLVFEDSWTGMSAAAAAGCAVLGLAETVPEGVLKFDPTGFVGAEAEDIADWFARAGAMVG